MAKRVKGSDGAGGKRASAGGKSASARSKTVAHQPSIVERDGAFYWLDAENDVLVGPFRTERAAIADRDSPGPADEDLLDIADVDAVLDAETEIGIDDFIDPDTGEPTHGYEPHVRDDH